jgi:hypothetical protein
MTGDLIERAVPLLRGAAADLADELAVPDARGSGVLGADTREVLRAAGCSPQDIDDLVAAGAARVADTPANAVRPPAEEP